MGRSTYRYHLQVKNMRGEWVAVFGTDDGLAYNLGRIAERRSTPGPRLAMRCVRSDGRVMGKVSEETEVDLGMIAGFPTPLQYASAALRALERGGFEGEVVDGLRDMVARLAEG